MDEIENKNRILILEKLRNEISKSNKMIIGIDGIPGSGKTNLGHYLASELILNCIHLDSFLTLNLDCFKNALNLGLLLQHVNLNLKIGKPFIVEGCCLLDVMRSFNLELDYIIYCKKFECNDSRWAYECYLDEYSSESSQSSLSRLDQEILEYHKGVKPHLHDQVRIIYKLIT